MVIDVTEPQPHLIEWNRSRWNTAAKQTDATTEDAKKKCDRRDEDVLQRHMSQIIPLLVCVTFLFSTLHAHFISKADDFSDCTLKMEYRNKKTGSDTYCVVSLPLWKC